MGLEETVIHCGMCPGVTNYFTPVDCYCPNLVTMTRQCKTDWRRDLHFGLLLFKNLTSVISD